MTLGAVAETHKRAGARRAHDFICGPAWERLLHEGIAGPRFVLLEDSGHLGHIEQPDTFASAITEFTRDATHAAGS
ncbi:alpha/beta fold hydrolase [Microtetraspora fusca]|uniref:alpha/beta fold hydrolase n=1 Tax=Microtetraspora fusca TaxID=1997 RepID=UPI0008329248|nr:hypothetical protein [Microtetraspora fusca]